MIGRRQLMGGMIGAGAAGGLGAPRHDQHYEPPRDAAPVPGARAVVRAQKVVVIGANGGVFVYNGTPLHGRLIASIASPAVTNDGHGNAVLSGVVSYLPGSVSAFAVQILGQQIIFNTAHSESGPWTAQGTIQDGLWNEPSGGQIQLAIAGGTQLEVQQAQILLGVLLNAAAAITVAGGATITGGATVTGGEAVDQVTINGTGTAVPLIVGGAGLSHTTANLNGASNSSVLRVLNTQASPNNPLVLIEPAAAGDPSIRIDVSGDTNARYAIDSTGVVKWGNGTNAVDTRLYRAAAGQLAADSIAANLASNTAEVWNPVTFANGWANAVVGANLQYRLVAAPYNEMQWVGRIVAPAGLVAGQAINVALPAAYRPAHIQSVLAMDITSGGIVRFQMQAAGTLLYESGAVAGDSIEIPSGLGLVSLDA